MLSLAVQSSLYIIGFYLAEARESSTFCRLYRKPSMRIGWSLPTTDIFNAKKRECDRIPLTICFFKVKEENRLDVADYRFLQSQARESTGILLNTDCKCFQSQTRE
jgi:predicted component of type VI protein secretion system